MIQLYMILIKEYIFGTIKQQFKQKDKGYLYHISFVEPYYLGAAYLLIRKKLDHKPIHNLQKNIFIFMIIQELFLVF